ncbi:MAG: Azurin [Sphingobacteriales bacterium]|nr:MAG: Azurin [Sphingobacteriales bacterium]
MKSIKTLGTVLLISSAALYSCGAGEDKKVSTTETPTSMIETPASMIETTDSTVVVNMTGDDKMKFNISEIMAKAGQKITIHLKNIGNLPKETMSHNFILLKQGTDVAAYALKAMSAKDSEYFPEAEKDKTIAHTKMLGPGESDSISFDAPAPGKYEYICSFPGHFSIMRGTLIIQ